MPALPLAAVRLTARAITSSSAANHAQPLHLTEAVRQVPGPLTVVDISVEIGEPACTASVTVRPPPSIHALRENTTGRRMGWIQGGVPGTGAGWVAEAGKMV